LINSLIDNYNASDIYQFEHLQQLCIDTKKEIKETLGEEIITHDKRLAIYYDQLETLLANKRRKVLQKDIDKINAPIKGLERFIILSDNEVIKEWMFDCSKLNGRISFISDYPIGLKSKVILDINEMFVKCYRGRDNAIHRLRTKMLRHEKMGIKNERVHLTLFAMYTKRYEFVYYGNRLSEEKLGEITKYFSEAQIAEGKVLKKFGELKRKYPMLKDEVLLRSEEIGRNKKNVAYNMGMAVGVAAKDVLFKKFE
jgi:hypothetical protein